MKLVSLFAVVLAIAGTAFFVFGLVTFFIAHLDNMGCINTYPSLPCLLFQPSLQFTLIILGILMVVLSIVMAPSVVLKRWRNPSRQSGNQG